MTLKVRSSLVLLEEPEAAGDGDGTTRAVESAADARPPRSAGGVDRAAGDGDGAAVRAAAPADTRAIAAAGGGEDAAPGRSDGQVGGAGHVDRCAAVVRIRHRQGVPAQVEGDGLAGVDGEVLVRGGGDVGAEDDGVAVDGECGLQVTPGGDGDRGGVDDL